MNTAHKRSECVALRWVRRLVAFAAFLTIATSAVGAEKLCDVDTEISNESYAALAVDLQLGCRHVYISSPGGDVAAALGMGRMLRKYQAIVIVPRGKECASACVFLYAAGVNRLPYGPVKVHRPYHLTATSTFAKEQERYDRLGAEIKAYLRSMNVRETLLDEMLKTPPESARALTLEEMEQFGLTLIDPVYAEFLDSQRAKRMGLSKQAYLRKKAATSRECGSIDEVTHGDETERRFNCWKALMPKYFPE